MSYVGINPVRAGIAETPEDSDFTSIQQRIRVLGAGPDTDLGANPAMPHETPPSIPLASLIGNETDTHPNAIGFDLIDYLELIDWSGRAIRDDKRGAIDDQAPPILTRRGLDPERLLMHIGGGAVTERPTMLGRADHIKQAAHERGRRFVKGMSEAKRLYLPTAPA